ncbi:Ser/Thr protein kinase RdoA (MazF antagonist) [Paenibacillus turicensis]|uniref:Ser/Thr protein kinase RdoA (MazF antagonist) n=1 Tax=Paenibacillus turicensis TaxID=160487 RepID=A0ABS4FXI0_9BACL|nr:phosphotransferase [Paenibacillus turicensis]MBP1907293.1 Ser/Thr protein kinase RdoA (MazF antagonist) [Paenibacillus turicensis]
MSTLVQQIVQQYWGNWTGQQKEGKGGWNNTTYFVQEGPKQAVVRIYNTHQDIEKIKFEHHVLELLGQQTYTFQVPQPLTALNGETVVQVSDGSGRYACLFEYIEGASMEERDALLPSVLGEATGELSLALSRIKLERASIYPPYYELKQAYPLCTNETLLSLCYDPPDSLRDVQCSLAELCEAFQMIIVKLDNLRNLPHQLVHGDLNHSNLLTEQGQVKAWLDFEFCTNDVRVMEIAVLLGDLLGDGEGVDSEQHIEQFCLGFRHFVRLEEEEIKAIPLLMLLRKVDVFLHFTSRYLEQIDPPSVLSQQAELLCQDLQQLRNSDQWLTSLLLKSLG